MAVDSLAGQVRETVSNEAFYTFYPQQIPFIHNPTCFDLGLPVYWSVVGILTKY